ncbi:hypothetical protein QTI42_03015 [Clostridium perfringens]|uniref:hypothetical protein n=1 Tax=Clostridium perfringens TaxID=1502 RepID=UPI002975B4F3|nr:hypothetical protein [Clostridium perfringens]MDM0849057.1 hypothetical protein [Clostridium perfringens]MDM0869836.1 hypothetical protein [Clostridium perfringens]MDM0872764.1 hypothetical protein [Clostridium perfringens]
MDKKKENIKTLFYIICASLALFLVISSLSSFFFYINGYFQFKDWISSVVSLAGALIGGIFTMLGVVLSLNRSISEREELEKKEVEKRIREEREFLRTQSFIVKSEMESYLKSIDKCVMRAIQNKIFDLCSTDKSFDDFCDIFMVFDNIYFMTDGVREKFYEIISRVECDDKKDIINIFIKLYTNHERIRKICCDKEENSIDILDKVIINNFNSELIVFKSEIFNEIDLIKKDFKEGILKEKDFKEESNKVMRKYGKSYNKEFLVEEYIRLVKFLEKVSE